MCQSKSLFSTGENVYMCANPLFSLFDVRELSIRRIVEIVINVGVLKCQIKLKINLVKVTDAQLSKVER